MPGWLQVVSKINPLSYEVDALRGLLLGTHAHLLLDFGVLVVAAAAGIAAASASWAGWPAEAATPRWTPVPSRARSPRGAPGSVSSG